ncbi:MAG: hypothetical protein LBI57_08455 [Helicobacteraceae bacterium]|jgi:hypothetical protein|nr:hypothetical protein [Helicobacteraceae bacterium]
MVRALAILAAIAAIAFFLFGGAFGRKRGPRDEVEDLIRCDMCGAYLTRKEAIVKGGGIFCSKECAEKRR